MRADAPRARAAELSYWDFADRVQDRLDAHWREDRYAPARAMLNANLLLTHAAAALTGHSGPARQDERARALVDQLCHRAWTEKPGEGSVRRAPGRRRNVGGRPPASFGVVVRSGRRVVLASQRPLEKSSLSGSGMTIQSTHRFTAGWIESSWEVTGLRGRTMEVDRVAARPRRRATAPPGDRVSGRCLPARRAWRRSSGRRGRERQLPGKGGARELVPIMLDRPVPGSDHARA